MAHLLFWITIIEAGMFIDHTLISTKIAAAFWDTIPDRFRKKLIAFSEFGKNSAKKRAENHSPPVLIILTVYFGCAKN